MPVLNPQNTTDWNYPKFERIWNDVLIDWRSTSAAREAGCAVDAAPTDRSISRRYKQRFESSSNGVHSNHSNGNNYIVERYDSYRDQTKDSLGEAKRERKRAISARRQKQKQEEEDEDLKRYPSLFHVLLRVFWRSILRAHLCKLAQDLIQYMNPVWLGYFALTITNCIRHLCL